MLYSLPKKITSFLTSCFFIALLGCPAVLNAQVISWNPVSTGTAGANPWTPGTIATGVTSPTNGISRGSSISGNGTGGCYGGPCSGGYLPTPTGTSADDAKSHTFTIVASCGILSLSSIDGATRRSGTGPTTANVYFALNGATTYTFIGSWSTNATSGTTGTPGSLPLSGIAALQSIPAGTTVKFIITPVGGGTSGTWYFTSGNLSVSGSVGAVSAPAIVTGPATVTIPAASNTSFSVSGVTGAASYQWQRNTSGIVGGTWVNITAANIDPVGTYANYTTTTTATSNTLNLNNVPASWDGWGYRCVVTNCAGSTNSTAALLNVSSGTCSGTPNAGSAIPTTASFCGTGTTTINLVGGSTGGGLTYQWSSSNTNTPPGSNISGATNASYTAGPITNTTYYWVTTNCTTTSLSNISSVGVVTVNPTPALVVTPPGGDYCVGTSGLSMTASGANNYSWAPTSGLSTTVGASVVATPATNTTYTVTGTSAAGCSSTATVTVNNFVTPGAINITPSATVGCLNGSVNTITASLGSAGPATFSSGPITATFAGSAPVTVPLAVSTIPVGATITSVSVSFDATQASGAWDSDDIINLRAPNGNILNLVNAKGGSGSTGGFAGTNISSASATAIPATGAPYTGTYAADASLNVGAAGAQSNVSTWSGLYSVPNGSWDLLGHYTFASGNTTFTSATITINYTLPSFTWAPITNLFTNPAGTTPYTTGTANVLYENPLTQGVVVYTVAAANGSCASATTTTVTVNPLPTPITGNSSLCAGLTTTLSDGITGGTWTSSNTSVATVDAVGVVNGSAAGNTVISFSNGCAPDATATVTIIAAPVAITGTLNVCSGLTTSLSNASSGGTWSSNNTTVATIDINTGVVTGGTAGNAVISYATGCGTAATATVTVIAAPTAISGVTNVCAGLTTTLSDMSAGGTWTSVNTSVATVGATGIVTGIIGGTSVINYSTGCGADVSATVTVIPSAGPISGILNVCAGLNTTLSNAIAGGTWSSSNSTVATITNAGVVTGGIAGISVVGYTTGCGTNATATVTVIAAPQAINGLPSVCSGSSITLSDAVTGGTWTSSNSAVATIISTGVVTGGIAGTSTINYTTGCGADVTATVTVISSPAIISGASSICAGGNTTLSDAVSGGTWSSNNTLVATVDAAGHVVAGTAGAVTIRYTTGCGTDATKNITVIAAPLAISGNGSVCVGAAIPLSDVIGGGTWSSNNSSVATINTSGVVSGSAAGTATINYSTGCGTDVTKNITVIAAPGIINGATTVCAGAAIILSDAVANGTWSSSNSAVATITTTGIVSGSTPGITSIGYTTGCGANVNLSITVLGAPGLISGLPTVCAGANLFLSDATTNGTWSSNATTVATVNATGRVTGVVAGNAVISYSTGCGTNATKTVTVIASPGVISGGNTVCVGSAITLSDAVAGGTWGTSTSAIAVVNTTGVVTGNSAGIAVINYSTGCGADATRTVTVVTSPLGITAPSFLCAGSDVILSNSIAGGTWSSSNSSVATINAAGDLFGNVAGTTTVSYSTGCGSPATRNITIVALPGVISGPTSVCAGATIELSDAVNGGTWSTSNSSVITVTAAGIVTGGTPGLAFINYTTGCGIPANVVITVVGAPDPVISGTLSVCSGSSVTLSNATFGGTWSSNSNATASVTAAGIVTGGIAGTAVINYSTGCGADAVATFTVNPLPVVPPAITGQMNVCVSSTVALSDAVAGAWSINNTTIATVDASGNVTGIAAGAVPVTYTVTNICGSAFTTATINVEAPLAAPAGITGSGSVCENSLIALSDATIGGVWSSANTSNATVTLSGVVIGVSAGNATISYTIANSCGSIAATATITVDALPAPAAIIGSTAPFCAGTTIALSDPTTGGTWSSNITTIATVDNAGAVLGLSAGSSTIFYSLTNGCGTVATTLIISVDPLPILGNLSGVTSICLGNVTALSDTAAGGVWSSSNTGIATVDNAGLVTSAGAGTAIISYSVINACGLTAAIAPVTISTIPSAGFIEGIDSVCPGFTITLSDPVTGGTWTSDFPTIANVNNAGVITPVAPGFDTIRYTVANMCGSAMAKMRIKVLSATSQACNPQGVGTVATGLTELKVFPNPNSGAFTVNLLTDVNEPVHIIITNMVGEKVREFSTTTNTDNAVSMDNAAGIYFISAATAHGTNTIKVMIAK